MEGRKAEQTINSEEMPVAHAEWAPIRAGVWMTVFFWLYDTGSGGCFLLKHEGVVGLLFFVTLFIFNVGAAGSY